MTTPEVHNIKHEIIDGKIVVLEENTVSNTHRINILEGSDRVLNEQMKNVVSSVNSLINWIKWGLGFAIVSYMAFFSWLMQQQLK